MSRIGILLENILKAVYGKDVRQSIHDSIEQCYIDVSSAKTLADDSVTLMQENIDDCNGAATSARSAADTANSSASIAEASAATANTAASNANASASACDAAVDALPDQVTEVFTELGITKSNGKLCVEVERE